MKIYIPSKGRADKISTHHMLQNKDYTVVVHNEEELKSYAGAVNLSNLEVSHQPFSISAQRNWIMENLVKEGDWFCFMDDNIRYLTAIPSPYYEQDALPKKSGMRFLEDNKITADEFISKYVREAIDIAEWQGASFIGFASQHNYFFRTNKWKKISLIVSKLCLMKKDRLRYNEQIQTMDDYEMSIQKMLQDGQVLVNNFIHPVANHNQPGGLGTMKERGNKKVQDCKLLMETYPGLLRYKERKNSVPGGEVCLRFYGTESFKRWKENHVK